MEKINKLKKIFKENNIEGYIIPKNDEFFGEYIPENKDRLRYISNFSGSYGFALILNDKNYLFVDGRYSLQAKMQSGNYLKIKTIPKQLPYNILKNKKIKIGYDPKLFTKKDLNFFFGKTECIFEPIKRNLIDDIWIRNTKNSNQKFYILPRQSVGQSHTQKINQIVSNMIKKKADFYFITAGENIAWLLNIRGKDTNYSPIPNGYILIDKKKNIKFFCDLKKISYTLRKKLNVINFLDIKTTNLNLLKIIDKKIIIDKNTCSIYFENILLKHNEVLDQEDPIYLLKSVKSKNEISNIKRAHIYDGAALTKFLFWIKENYLNKKITEISASDKLYNFRKKNKKFQFLSFPTISGAGPNGAIIHYKATKKSNRQLKKGDVYLVDSGGQYNFGTTDVTRTISLQVNNKKIKNIFTRVLKGHIAVANFKLKKNTSGSDIDHVARKFLKQVNLDYAHGTGHGVGYFLNVHEGPQAISKNNRVNFKPGMVVSNEPGYYEKNKFGIRIENLIYVKKNGSKLCFDNLTMAPIDKDFIDQSILNKKEILWLNNYHKGVYINLKKFMNKTEVSKLKQACSAI
jgi:Xaa-Pro aminopeptidase